MSDPTHGVYKRYDKPLRYQTIHDFLKSNERVLLLEYNGRRLNSRYGLKDDLIRSDFTARKIKWGLKLLIQPFVFGLLKHICGGEFKNSVYRAFGVKIGKEVFIAPNVYIDDFHPELISIGDGSIIGEHATILAHEFLIKHIRLGRVNIGKQSVIGAFSIIRSGVNIGNHSIVSMDTYVNKDVPPSDEVGGIPAHEIKKLKELV